MTRLRGRAPVGDRLLAKVPHGHWQTTTLIAALGIGGIRCSAVIDGAVNAEAFQAFVEQVLVPQLRPGDVVVLDNLSSHKRSRTHQLIQSVGADLLFLPPYSPDLNPIENAFSKLKGLLRKAAERTVEGPWVAIGRLLDRFPPDECRNYFRHCGYAATPS